MRVTGFSRRRPRRFDGAEAAAFPCFDLLREQRQREALLGRLDVQSRLANDRAAVRLQQMFTIGRVKLTAGAWRETLPQADFWLVANCRQRPDQAAWFGLDGVTLFALSELFFGSNGKVKERQQHNVTETEERLAKRLFLCQLTELGRALGVDTADWTVRWVADGPGSSLPTCEVSFDSDPFQCRWQMCWPADLDGVVAPQPLSPDVEQQLSRAVARIPMRMRVEVAALAVALGRLGDLRVGEVLPLNLHDQSVARIGDVACCQGRVAEDGGDLVLQVTKVIGAVDG